MGLIVLGIMFAIIAAALVGIGNAWERNIRNGEPRKSHCSFSLDMEDKA